MKTLRLLLMVLVATPVFSPLFGQNQNNQNGSVAYVQSAPTGACYAGALIQQLVTSTGATYTCQSITAGVGTWTLLGGSGSGTVSGQVVGQLPLTTNLGTALTFTTPVEAFVSAWCQSSTSCNPGGGIADESQAIRAIQTFYNCCTANGVSLNIIDDMTGTQTWSEEPLINSFIGRFDFKTNGASHQVRLDGMSTFTIPSGVQSHGMGGSSSDNIPENTTIAACNPLTDNCANGGFQIQNSSSTTLGLSASGSLTTVTFGASVNFSTSTTAVNQLTAGRKLCIAGATGTIWNGCFTVNSVTGSSGAVTAVVLNTDSTEQTGSCASPCTAAVAYLNTPVVSIGAGGGGGAYGTRLGDIIIDGHLMIGSSCLADGQGEEGAGTDGAINCYNTPESGFDFEQSSIYGGPSSSGLTNTGPYNSLAVNFNPFPVTLIGGANCSNAGFGTCNGSGKVPVGSGILCTAPANTSNAANFGVLTPNPCVNPGWVAIQETGLVGTQGNGPIMRATVSCADKAAAGSGCIFQPLGQIQPTGLVCMGIHCSFGDIHTEFMQNGVDFCGDSAINNSLYAVYGTTITSGVNWFAGGLIGFTGIGVDIGTSGNGATCNDINILGANIGAKTGTLIKDNITACTITGSSTEQVETYMLGHGSPQGRWSSSPQCSNIVNSETIGSTSAASTPSGVENATVGFQINGAAASKSVLCGNGTDFISCLSGVPVDATNPATLLSTDRANYLNWTSGTALALPAVSGNFASNFPFNLKNTAGSTLTITPNAGASDLCDGSATCTILNNWDAFIYQDSTSAPGHWFTVKLPTFAAFGSTCANPLAWSTTTGFSCLSGTSGGVPYFSAANTWGTSGALTSNVLIKGGGAGNPPANSLFTDTGTTATYTGTGGVLSPIFTANGTTAGFFDFPQGSTSAAVAPCNTANSICYQAPTSVTAQLRVFASTPATGFELFTNSAGTMTETISATSGTLTSGVGTWGNSAINTVLASTVANVAGHFTNLQVVTALFGTCTTAPIFNVFDGTTNTGSTVTAAGSTQTKGTGTSTAQTLTFAAGDIIGIYISSAGGTCTADLYTVTAQYSIP
jgi:hypothetical protein